MHVFPNALAVPKKKLITSPRKRNLSTPGTMTPMVLLWVGFALQLVPMAWYFMAHDH
jgi:hypothetical protein